MNIPNPDDSITATKPEAGAEKRNASVVCEVRRTVEHFRILQVCEETGAAHVETADGNFYFFSSPDAEPIACSMEEVANATSFIDYRILPFRFPYIEDVRKFLYDCAHPRPADPDWEWAPEKSLIRFASLDKLQELIVEARQNIEDKDFSRALIILEVMQYANEADESIWQKCKELVGMIVRSEAEDVFKQRASACEFPPKR